ncbi:chemotaxis protein [Cyanobium sp. CH-040]|uniref:chemotaxis protein n=1 Tax=Cyanobium sp. CH-040 TaxID=2823708 RepID=UPI0020CEBCB0|nr:chemotaxis protein [Cyanobium sp. CH-040]MCP9927136.1 chemotaxis protein [Cyanobium sp. CH-040]
MTSASVSFRITRSTEDLAQTTHALSLRLVKLEQRLEALELQIQHALERRDQRDPLELNSLENVERLLHDCRSLLGLDAETAEATAVVPVSGSAPDSSFPDTDDEFESDPADLLAMEGPGELAA